MPVPALVTGDSDGDGRALTGDGDGVHTTRVNVTNMPSRVCHW
jgi:hypothetical protein